MARNLGALSETLKKRPGVDQTVLFGSVLHVSGSDGRRWNGPRAKRRRATAAAWRRTDTGLEDVFIHLMSHAVDRTGIRP